MSSSAIAGPVQNLTLESLVRAADLREAKSAGKIFTILLPLQWLFVTGVSIVATPLTWIGADPSLNIHVVASIVLGALLTLFPMFLIRWDAGANLTKFAVAAAQLLYSGLIIHVTGGRIESHFHIFASLALLAFYRDWKVVVIGSAVTALDHVARGLLVPLSIFGSPTVSLLRVLEHAGWVVFMDLFLIIWIAGQVKQVKKDAEQELELNALQARTSGLLDNAVGQLRTGSDLEHGTESALAQTADIRKSTEALSAAAEGLRKAVSTAEETTEKATRGVASLEESAHRQAQAIEHTGAEIKRMVESAETVSEVSEVQNSRVQELRQETEDILKGIHETVELLRNLGQASSEISNIVGVIRNVAGQTQLLALNAAIEAAHAGTAGKGFAVVAGEIRKLSEQTTQQVAQISEQVDVIVQGLGKADSHGHGIEKGFELVAKNISSTNAAFTTIAERIAQVRSGAQRIVSAGDDLARSAQLVQDAAHQTQSFQESVRETLSAVDTIAAAVHTQAATINTNAAQVAATILQANQVAQTLNHQLQSMK